VTAAVIVAALAKFAMGTRPLIVGVALVTFLIAGNGAVWLSGSKQRAIRLASFRTYSCCYIFRPAVRRGGTGAVDSRAAA
jgi:hypothetical protein